MPCLQKNGAVTPQYRQRLCPAAQGRFFSCRIRSVGRAVVSKNHRPQLFESTRMKTQTFCKQKTASVSLRRRSFYGRGWITQAAHLKKPRRGFFPRRTVRRVDAVRIHPPSLREGYYKTETPVPGSDTGVLGGRGWIRTSSTITIRWMRFEIVMDSCVFFECHRKSIIGYHNHLGTKTGYKVGYFARGEYSARASETAIAAVSALPSTA